jgi:hypothetical protein
MRSALCLAGGLLVVSAAGAVAAVPGGPGFTPSDFNLVTAQDLLDVCTIPEDNADYVPARALCYGYFAGGQDFHDAVAAVAQIGPIACPDHPQTRDALVAVFVAYANQHPEMMSQRPMDVVFEAVAERWPCPKRSAMMPATAAPVKSR